MGAGVEATARVLVKAERIHLQESARRGRAACARYSFGGGRGSVHTAGPRSHSELSGVSVHNRLADTAGCGWSSGRSVCPPHTLPLPGGCSVSDRCTATLPCTLRMSFEHLPQLLLPVVRSPSDGCGLQTFTSSVWEPTRCGHFPAPGLTSCGKVSCRSVLHLLFFCEMLSSCHGHLCIREKIPCCPVDPVSGPMGGSRPGPHRECGPWPVALPQEGSSRHLHLLCPPKSPPTLPPGLWRRTAWLGPRDPVTGPGPHVSQRAAQELGAPAHRPGPSARSEHLPVGTPGAGPALGPLSLALQHLVATASVCLQGKGTSASFLEASGLSGQVHDLNGTQRRVGGGTLLTVGHTPCMPRLALLPRHPRAAERARP